MASMAEFQGENHFWPKITLKAHLTFGKKHLNDHQDFWENILSTDKTRWTFWMVTHGVKVTQHFRKRTSYQQSNMVVVVWWSGAALLLQDLDDLLWLMEPWILLSTKKSWRRMSGHQFVTSSWSALGFCSRTMIQNTPASPPLNGSKKTNWRFWSGLVKVRTWIRLRCCGLTLKAVHARKPSNVAELKQFCKEEWAKIPPQRCERLIASYHKCFDCSCCCWGWHNQLLGLGGNYFFT